MNEINVDLLKSELDKVFEKIKTIITTSDADFLPYLNEYGNESYQIVIDENGFSLEGTYRVGGQVTSTSSDYCNYASHNFYISFDELNEPLEYFICKSINE